MLTTSFKEVFSHQFNDKTWPAALVKVDLYQFQVCCYNLSPALWSFAERLPAPVSSLPWTAARWTPGSGSSPAASGSPEWAPRCCWSGAGWASGSWSDNYWWGTSARCSGSRRKRRAQRPRISPTAGSWTRPWCFAGHSHRTERRESDQRRWFVPFTDRFGEDWPGRVWFYAKLRRTAAGQRSGSKGRTWGCEEPTFSSTVREKECASRSFQYNQKWISATFIKKNI